MKRFFVILLVITSSFPIVYAQTIPITISSRMSNVIFDGKWSFMQEWKESSLTQIDSNSGPIYIRTAHWQNYVYVMIDAASITSFEKNSDSIRTSSGASQESLRPRPFAGFQALPWKVWGSGSARTAMQARPRTRSTSPPASVPGESQRGSLTAPPYSSL